MMASNAEANQMSETQATARSKFSLRTLFSVFTAIGLLLGGCTVLVKWVNQPRIADWEVRKALMAQFPLGMLRSDVEAKLREKYQQLLSFDDSFSESVIECWIVDTGSKFAMMPDDIRIEFSFDEYQQLKRLTAETESRF